MNPIRVCMISYTMPPLYSGSGQQALFLAQQLSQKGVSVSALTARHDEHLPQEESLDGVTVYRLPVLKRGQLRPLSYSLAAASYLFRHQHKFDIIHIHTAYWRILPILLVSKLTGKKSLVKMSQLGTDDPQAIRQRRLGNLLYRTLTLTDNVISISKQLSQSYLKSELPADKLLEIPNGVDTDNFSPASPTERTQLRTQLKLPQKIPLIVFVGEVGYRKGIDYLLKAWAKVSKEVPDAKLVLVGPIPAKDPDQPHNAASIGDLLAGSSQTLAVGLQANVSDYLRAADLFVFPSRQEGLPNALIEAMAVGLPCIASDIEGNVDIIDPGQNGLLVPNNNIEALNQTVIRLLNQPREREQLGHQARKSIMTSYSMQSVTERYISLYRQLLA